MATYAHFVTAIRVTTEARHVGPLFDEFWPVVDETPPEPEAEWETTSDGFWKDHVRTRESTTVYSEP